MLTASHIGAITGGIGFSFNLRRKWKYSPTKLNGYHVFTVYCVVNGSVCAIAEGNMFQLIRYLKSPRYVVSEGSRDFSPEELASRSGHKRPNDNTHSPVPATKQPKGEFSKLVNNNTSCNHQVCHELENGTSVFPDFKFGSSFYSFADQDELDIQPPFPGRSFDLIFYVAEFL